MSKFVWVSTHVPRFGYLYTIGGELPGEVVRPLMLNFSGRSVFSADGLWGVPELLSMLSGCLSEDVLDNKTCILIRLK